MVTFVYRCPNTALKVQGFSSVEVPDGGAGGFYTTLTCTACRQIHLVNPKTGSVFGRVTTQAGSEEVVSGKTR
jgi:hypothetical protein